MLAACTSAAAPLDAGEPPPTLRETGFGELEMLPFAPQYPLWSDGATKRRWIHLPAGSSIDASGAWDFPVGTRLWKEFSFGRRVETRYMERGAGGWTYATYAWNDDGTEATRAPPRGLVTDVEVAPGVRHVIPGEGDCLACHATGPTPVLGFSALQLSPDRDPLAPHAEAPPDGAVDLASLAASGRLRGLPA